MPVALWHVHIRFRVASLQQVIVDDVEEYKWPDPGADVVTATPALDSVELPPLTRAFVCQVSRGRLRKGSAVEVIDVQELYCQIKCANLDRFALPRASLLFGLFLAHAQKRSLARARRA